MALLRYFFYAFASLVLSSSSFIFGGITQHALWKSAGRLKFLLINGLLVLGLVALGANRLLGPFLVVTFLVWVFTELEHKGLNLRRAGFLSVVAICLLTGVALLVWGKTQGVAIADLVSIRLKTDLEEIFRRFPEMKIKIDEFLIQIPSMYFIGLASTLWMTVIFERKVRITFGDRVGVKRVTYLSDFRVPMYAVWPAMASFVGAFILKGNQAVHAVSINLFNVFVFIYFLQGIAVVATMFRVYRVRLLWQMLSYFILFVQLVPVSLFGLLDFWFDFRSKMERKSPEIV